MKNTSKKFPQSIAFPKLIIDGPKNNTNAFMRNILTCLIIILLPLTTLAQTRIVAGKVVSSDDGAGLPGVSVGVKGSSKGTMTDIDGNYTIELTSEENDLIFSFVGFQSQTVSVGDRTNVDVQLKEDSQLLNEVVVIGYGTVKKSDLTGSVSSMRGEDLVKIPSSSPEQALQGKVAGVQVTSPTGAPGSPPVIRIRGVGTLNNSSPIFVVDGVILDDITFLNTADIESMEILKDASATAIYGSRGANGVIIITTKSGKSETPVVSVSADYSLQHLAKRIDLLSGREFATVVNQITPGTYNNLDLVPNTDWQSLIFRDYAPIQTYQASISGSAGKHSYYFGGGYFNQEGIIPSSGYERVSIKSNNSYQVTNALKIGNNLTIAPDKRKNAANVVPVAYRAWPVAVPYNADGSFAEVGGAGNPLAALEYNNSTFSRIRAVGNIYADLTFLKNFLFKSSYGFDVSYGKTKSFTPAFFVSPQQQNLTSDLSVGTDEYKTWLWENTLTYSKTLDNHNLNVLAGFTLQKFTSEFLNGSVQNLIGNDPSLWYLDAGETTTGTQRVGNGGSISSLASYLFRVNYSFQDKYLLTVSTRVDGSSKFSKDNLYGTFPSLAVGWNVINENFIPDGSFLSNLKVRASWGVIGNEKIPADARFALIANGQNAVFGENEVVVPGATWGNASNPDLRWESTTQLDVGLEVGLWNDRLTAEFDYYNRETEDILVGLTAPGHVGNGAFVRVTTNAATVLNRGVEMTLSWNDQIGDFKYRLSGVASTIHNEVLDLGSSFTSDSFITSGSLGNGQLVSRTEVGRPIGSFYGYQVVGVFQNQQQLDSEPSRSDQFVGDLKYADINPDGIINTDDRTYIGSPIPDFIFGFGTEIGYKNFEISVDFQGQTGNEIYNGKLAVRPDLYNYEARVKNHWRGDGTSNFEPRPTAGGVNFEPSNYFIEDGSYLRLRNIRIGYSLPSSLSRKLNVRSAKFYVGGTNVFTSTKYSGYTPEIGGSDVISTGIDLGVYPVTAIYSIGFNLTL